MKTKILILISLAIGIFSFVNMRTITGTVLNKSDKMPIPGVTVIIKGTSAVTTTDGNGRFSIAVLPIHKTLIFSFVGMKSKEVKLKTADSLTVYLEEDASELSEVIVTGYDSESYDDSNNRVEQKLQKSAAGVHVSPSIKRKKEFNRNYFTDKEEEKTNEEYGKFVENKFVEVKKDALSTFSIDVDRASYSNVRRMLLDSQLPPKDAIRTEEMINYFDYNYPQPSKESAHPVAIHTEYADSPFNAGLKLFKIGIQAKKIETDKLPASNLVFLIDVSGSMMDEAKLPLLVKGFSLLVDQLREQDKVAIVVYAGAAGLVLPTTSGKDKTKIKEALEKLSAGGSTAGGEGIKLAYKIAQENFIKGGNNRVILASDGDFNVGVSSDSDLQSLIENKRESGVFLSVLGFGLGNYKDNKMETLADKGNGNYAYIDTILEAQKVFVTEFGGTLFTVAKDVKLQLEFNPSHVAAYRLIGYENRMLQNEDFNDDRKDAGDMGSGHTVTALYEIIPAGTKSEYLKSVDKLKYQKTKTKDLYADMLSKEVVTVKLRYKEPESKKSMLLETAVLDSNTKFVSSSENFQFAASVAGLGMLLRDSEFKGSTSFDQILETAKKAKGEDAEGYRAEFIKLVKLAKLLTNKDISNSGR